MSKHQVKASKLFGDFLKENQRRRTSQILTEMSEKSKSKIYSERQKLNDISLNIEYCSYCSKAFSDSRCLLKHILRRHSEELIVIHKQLIKGSNKQRKLPESDLKIKCTPTKETGIGELKKMLNDFKGEILEQFHSVNNNYSGNREHSNHELLEKTQELQKLQCEDFQKCSKGLQELNLQYQHFETLVQNLEEKNTMLIESIRHEIMSQEENRFQNDNEVRTIIQNTLKIQRKETSKVKEDLRKQLENIHQTVSDELKKQYLNLDNKIKYLESKHMSEMQTLHSLYKQNAARLERIQNDYNVEEQFEKHLKSYLNKMSMKPKRKCGKNRKFLRNSIHSNSQAVDSGNVNVSRLSQIPSRSNSTSSIIQKSKLTQHNEIPTTVRKSPNLINKNFINKSKLDKYLFITKRVKVAIQKDPNMLNKALDETSKRLENKLRIYGILPGQNKLPVSEFEIKKQLVNDEILRETYNTKDFVNLRNKINDLVTRKVRLYLSKNKKYKKEMFTNNLKSVVRLSAVENFIPQSFCNEYGDGGNISDDLEHVNGNNIHNLSETSDLQPIKVVPQEIVLCNDDLNNSTFSNCSVAEASHKFNNKSSYVLPHKISSLSNAVTNSNSKTIKVSSVKRDKIETLEKTFDIKSSSEVVDKQFVVRQDLNCDCINNEETDSDSSDLVSLPKRFFNSGNEINSDCESSLDTLSDWDSNEQHDNEKSKLVE